MPSSGLNVFAAALSFVPETCSVAAAALCCSRAHSDNRALHAASIDARLARWILTASPLRDHGNDVPPPRRFFDPHFHVWDMLDGPHDPTTLGGFLATFPRFSFADACKYVGGEPGDSSRFDLCGGVHVEAIPKDLDGWKEVAWVSEQLEKHQQQASSGDVERQEQKKAFFLNAFVDLRGEPAATEKRLRDMKATYGVTSIRQILNFEPSWPHITSNMLDDERWQLNFALIERSGIGAFDLQINPHQLPAAAALAAKHKSVRFVLNHLGCVTPEQLARPDGRDAYLRGMQQLARSSDAVFVKLSMMEYSAAPQQEQQQQQHWSEQASIRRLVADVLRIFGASRCMLASNFPVSLFPLPPDATGSAEDGYAASARRWRGWVASLCGAVGDAAAEELCYRTAARAYQLAL